MAEAAERSSGPDRVVLIGVYVGALRRPVEEPVPEAVRVPSER
ncbi:MAG TPA: hypothetical protein VFC08_05935 [Actinomycetota bacterium]|nr:hypothetical protein [Actinomycetota bacterium]